MNAIPRVNEVLVLADKVGDITGAASGLRLALAPQCAHAGMQLVLADVNRDGLGEIGRQIAALTPCVWQHTDARHCDSLDSLARLAFDSFGVVHVLFNNACVVIARPTTASSAADFQWMMDVNFCGVPNCVAPFLPKILEQDVEGRVVNTASAAEFVTVANLSAYCASKHAMVAYSECFQQELSEKDSKIGVTILSPAFISTGILDSQRWRPIESPDTAAPSAAIRLAEAQLAKAIGSGLLSADDVARETLAGIGRRALYVFPHPKIRAAIEQRMQAVHQAR